MEHCGGGSMGDLLQMCVRVCSHNDLIAEYAQGDQQ
jgi:hypothetical protein